MRHIPMIPGSSAGLAWSRAARTWAIIWSIRCRRVLKGLQSRFRAQQQPHRLEIGELGFEARAHPPSSADHLFQQTKKGDRPKKGDLLKVPNSKISGPSRSR